MKRKFYCMAFALITILCVLDARETWSLSDCIQHAMEHNLHVKRQNKEIERQAIQLQTSRLHRLPDVNAGGTQKFDFGRSLNRENTYDDTNSQNGALSLTTEVTLFNGMKTTHSIARQQLELGVQLENLEVIKNDLSLQIAFNYYQILLNTEIVRIAQEQITLSRELEEITKTLASHGKIASSQIYDVQAQVANDELNATKARNLLRMSVVELVQLLEMEDVGAFDVQAEQEEITSFLIQNPQDVYQLASQTMPQIRSAEMTVESSEKAIKIAQSGYYPTVSFAAGVSSGYYHYSNFENTSLGNQMENNLQKTVYLTMRIPIFNRNSTRNAIRTARKNHEESILIAEQSRKSLYKEIQKAYYDAISAQEKFLSTEKAVYANAEAMRYALEKYNAGKFTAYEYNEVKMKLSNSLSEQAQAKYEFMLQRKLLDFYAGIPIQ